MSWPFPILLFFFFNAPAPTEIYTLSLHDALPISTLWTELSNLLWLDWIFPRSRILAWKYYAPWAGRSEEHTSELQSHSDLVCRLLLEKKKKILRHAPTYVGSLDV